MLERTFDYRIVNKLAWWTPMISKKVIYLLDNKINLWAFYWWNDGYMVHAAMSQSCRGRKASISVKKAFKWIADHTSAKKIYAAIKPEKKHAGMLAISVGMEYTHTLNETRFYEKNI